MKKIIALNGSPHKHGCTAALMNEVVKSCEIQGAEVKTYYLNGMNIKPCQGCGGCKTQSKCIIKDDMQPLYDEISNADGIILATPVYFWQISAQLKTAIDRLEPFGRPNSTTTLKHGKKAVIAATQGRPDATAFIPYFEHVGRSLALIGCDAYEILIAGGTQQAEDVLKQTDVVERAKNLGVWLTD